MTTPISSNPTSPTTSQRPETNPAVSSRLRIITFIALAILLGGGLIALGSLGLAKVPAFSFLAPKAAIVLISGGAVLALFFAIMVVVHKSNEEPSSDNEKAPYFHIYGKYVEQQTQPPPVYTQLPQPLKNELLHLTPFFDEVLKDMALQQEKLTTTECLYAIRAILGLSILERHRDELAGIFDENARNRRINELTELGAEEGLIPGKDRETIFCSIDVLINQFKEAYETDKKNDNTFALFKDGFYSTRSCFNGKMIALSEYIDSKKGKAPTDDRTEYDDRACIYQEWIYNCQEALNLGNEAPTKEAFRAYVEGILAQGTLKDTLLNEELKDKNKEKFNAIFFRACEIAGI